MQAKKVLWITYNPLPLFNDHLKGKVFNGSPWLQPLASTLAKDENLEIGVVSPSTFPDIQKVVEGNIAQYTVPIDLNRAKFFSNLYPDLLDHYLKVIEDFQPSLIHVHGTEKYFGLIKSHVEVPVIVSIQGYVTACIPHLEGNISKGELKRNFSVKNLVGRGGIVNQKRNWKRYLAPMEEKIIHQNRYFIGRTIWDKEHLKAINKSAIYFQGEELLRPSFYTNNWDIKNIEKHSIFISNANYPLKGLHVVLNSLKELIKNYPDARLKVPMAEDKFWKQNVLWGNDYWRYLRSLIVKLALKKHVDFVGFQDEKGMANIFRKSHVFVMPSFMENSSNALGEAMMSGTPCIVNNVGGLVDIVEDEFNGLVMQNGDFKSLTSQIKKAFDNPELAQKLSINSKLTAQKRHSTHNTKLQYQNIYSEVMRDYYESDVVDNRKVS